MAPGTASNICADRSNLMKFEAERAPRANHLGESLGRWIGGRRRVAIDPHLVAEFSAEQLVARHAIDLADQVHQRDLDGADAARFAAFAAIALDPAEQVFDIAGVLPDQQRLQPHGRIGMGAVAHLAQAVDALVGLDLQDRMDALCPDRGDADVGDLQLRRLGRAANGVLDGSGDRHVTSL